MLFGQSGSDLVSHWHEEMASLYGLFHLLYQEFLTVRNHPQITLLFSFLTDLGKKSLSVKIKPPHWFRSYEDSFFLLQLQNIVTYDKKSFCKEHVIHRDTCLESWILQLLNFQTNFLSTYLE